LLHEKRHIIVTSEAKIILLSAIDEIILIQEQN
jgi:hypothetical protein